MGFQFIKSVQFFLLIILFCFQKIFASNYLKEVSFSGKENGLIVEFIFENNVSHDSINAWQSQTDWFYFTLYNVKSDTSELLSNTKIKKPVLDFQPILTDQSTQIGVKIKNKVESFDIFNANENFILNAHLHYPIENFAELASVVAFENKEKEFNSRFSRSKSWLMLVGSAFTVAGFLNDSDGLNTELKIGIGTLLFTYVLNKIWTSK